MVKLGDAWKTYLELRIKHLRLEREKVPHTTRKEDREKARRKLQAKIEELTHTKHIVHGNIKEHSKYEYRKVKHLEKMKVEALKGVG